MSIVTDGYATQAKIQHVLKLVEARLQKALDKHGPMRGPHEGWAVILEEVDELWDEVRKDGGGRDLASANEALDVAAMGLRYLIDVVEELP